MYKVHLRAGAISKLFYDFASVRAFKFIASLIDILMFYIEYLTMYKVRMHAGAIRKILYGCAFVQAIIHSLVLVDYLPLQTHKP